MPIAIQPLAEALAAQRQSKADAAFAAAHECASATMAAALASQGFHWTRAARAAAAGDLTPRPYIAPEA